MNGISESESKSISDILRSGQTVHSGYKVLYSHQQYMRGAISPHHHQYLFLSFVYDHPSGYGFHCGFDFFFYNGS